MATSRVIAEWMMRELVRVTYLAQYSVAWEISDRFGERFIYVNSNGNPAINRDVLREFDSLTKSAVVWEFASRLWRAREDYDLPSRRQP